MQKEITQFHLSEIGITNLGMIPEGMDIYTASVATRHLRKHRINPYHASERMTICEVIREIYRESEQDPPNTEKIRELCAAAFDYGKRMDARMKQLKSIIEGGDFC